MSSKISYKHKALGIGALMTAAGLFINPTTAMASPGCDAANAGTFNRSAPAGTNLNTQTSGTFDAGDILTAIISGTPLSLFIDIVFGVTPQQLISLANTNGSGSAPVTTSGTNVIDISIAAGAGGATNLVFTCTPAGIGSGAGTPASTEQSNTATNATTTSTIVENGIVNGIVGNAAQEDPGPSSIEIEAQEAANTLRLEQIALEKRQQELEADIKYFKENPASGSSGAFDAAGVAVLSGVGDQLGVREAIAESNAAEQEWLDRAERELKANIARQREIDGRLEKLPAPTVGPGRDFTPADPEELGDGESILFAPIDPFMRAINRYRGFTLNAAETTSSPGQEVTPLSFTRTLDPKTVGWVRAVYTDYEQDDASQQDGNDMLVALGAHRDFTDNLRLGAFVTAKWGSVKSPVNNLDIDTKGYSLGAYVRYRLGEEIDLNVSTRLGLTKNDIAVSGTTGSYDTRLASFTVGISGQEQHSDSIWMQPAISLTNTWVNREDYVNSAGTAIGGNTTWLGNVSAGPTIGTSLTPPSGFKRLEPAIGLKATYTYSDQDSQTGTVTTSDTDYLSLSLSPQLSMEFDNGASLDVFGSYFGIGADLDGWSVGGTLSIPLN